MKLYGRSVQCSERSLYSQRSFLNVLLFVWRDIDSQSVVTGRHWLPEQSSIWPENDVVCLSRETDAKQTASLSSLSVFIFHHYLSRRQKENFV